MGRKLVACLFLSALAGASASAQSPPSQGLVVRDNTLGEGRGEVVGPGVDPLGHEATYLITPDMGEQHDGNLFHSFESFGIGQDETATFTGPDPVDGPQSVDNVISRVTGGDESRIDGTLRSTIPGADVWLLNPNGVVFGEGAQLDVPGSFHASTGDYVGFGAGDLVRFYADPSRPSVLSTAPPVAFGFLGQGPAAAISLEGAALAVPKGETLELVAGEVVLDAATLTAEDGRVNLAAVASAGEVVLGPADAAEPLDVSRFETLGEIRLQARDDVGSLVDASGDSPGSVFIRGGQLVVEGHRRAPRFEDDEAERSRILAENRGPGPGGSLSIETSESVLVDNGLLSVNTTSAGDAGSIYVKSPIVTFQNGPGWFDDFENVGPHAIRVGARAETSGSAAAGTIEIVAEKTLTLQNGVSVSAQAFGPAATGDAGTIAIDAGSMEVLDRSDVSAHGSQGNAGTIQIDVAGNLLIDHANIWTTSLGDEEKNGGAPGRIDIEASSVELHFGGIQSYCDYCRPKTNADDRPADAGLIRIVANRVVIEGSSAISSSLVNAGANGDGDAGTIEIETGSLEVRRGVINASTGTPGEGAGGSITIDADSVVITEQGLVNALTSGAGAGGTISVDARTVLIEGQGIITAGATGRATGAAGTVDVNASEWILVSGAGDRRFSLLEIVQILELPAPYNRPPITGIFSANGNGSITLDAPDLTLTEGAIVMASTGTGDAGSIFLSGDRIHVLNGAFVDSTSYVRDGPGGNVGNITLEGTELIEVVGSRAGVVRGPWEDPSRVTSANLSSGEGGAVALRAPRILIDGGAVATTTLPSLNGWEGASGGNISVSAGELIVRGGGRIDASSFVPAPGGAIDITASDSIVVEGQAADGTASGISGRTGSASGDGGGVTLRAPVIEVGKFGEISVKSEADPSLEGEAARIFDSLRDDKAWIGTPLPKVAEGDAGTVTLAAEVVVLQNGSSIVADAGLGTGGNIQVTADNYFAFPGSVVNASSDLGIDGIVEVHTPDVDLAGTLTALPASYLDAASLMRERCAARRSGERAGSFAVRGNGGIPAQPDGWLPATLASELERGPLATTERSSTSASAPRPARLGTCQ